MKRVLSRETFGECGYCRRLRDLGGYNTTAVVKRKPQSSITGFFIALAAGAFHDALEESDVNQQFARLLLQDFVADRFVANPAVLAAKSGQFSATF